MNIPSFSFRHDHPSFAGEQRRIAFFENTPEFIPSQEALDAKKEKSPDTPDDNHEKNDEQTEETMKKIAERIEQGDKAQKKEAAILESTLTFQKEHEAPNSLMGDLENVEVTMAKDAGDLAEEVTDIETTVGLSDTSQEIGQKPAPNEMPDVTRTEAREKLHPAEQKTEEGAQREQEEETKKVGQTNATPSETPEGSKPQ